ncbi:MAG: hypothetical protein QM644_11910, partial [Mobilitalea sp.]
MADNIYGKKTDAAVKLIMLEPVKVKSIRRLIAIFSITIVLISYVRNAAGAFKLVILCVMTKLVKRALLVSGLKKRR